jgi:protein transport protein SEC20
MRDELSRSRFAQETLEQSTAALENLGEQYSDLNTLLANSRNLVSTLLKSQKSDTWYLETTFYVLITTVIWLIFRRWLYGPLTWFLIWPLKLVFRIVFAVVPVGAASSAASSSVAVPSSSKTLIVQPSATGGIPRREPNAQPHYIPVGRGGGGPKQNPDPSPQGSYSQQVGQMAEQNQQQQQEEEVPDHPQFRQPRKDEDDGPVTLGDGTVLKESSKPRNPKKKMWDEDVERRKLEEAQQKEQQQQQQEVGGEKNRDEL